MDLFNPPKELNYTYMSHKLNVDTLENPYIQVVWEDTPDNFTQERLKRVRSYFEKKYKSKNVNVITKVKTEDMDVQSVDVSMNILDENFQKELIKKYLIANGYEKSLDEVLNIDLLVEDKIASEKADITPFKKWYIKNIEFSNFLSFGDKQVLDFEKVEGITAVESNPPNFGGKTVLTVDLLLFLFFNTTTKTNKAEEIFNRFRNKDKVVVKGEIQIDGEDYIIVREVNRKLKRNKTDYTVSTSLEFFKKLSDGSLQNFTGEQRRETEEFIKKSIGTMDDFLMTILTTSTNLEELIDSKPTARGQVLSRFLGLDSLKLKEDVAKEITSNYSKGMISNIYNIESLKEEIEIAKIDIEQENLNIQKYVDELNDVNGRIEKGQGYRDDLIRKKHIGLDDELLRINPDSMKDDIKEYGSKIGVTLKELTSINVVEPSKYYHEDEHDQIKEKLSNERVNEGTMSSKKEDIVEELKTFEDGLECQYCGIVLAQSTYTEKRKKELEDINIGLTSSTLKLKELLLQEQSFVNLKKDFDTYERNKLIKEKFEIQLETLELKKSGLEDKLKRFKEVQIKLEENKKIDETILKADMRLDVLTVERDGVNTKISESKNNIKNRNSKIDENNSFIIRIKDEEKKLRLYKIYLELFGKKGITKMIMRSMTPVINSELQRLLIDSAEFKLEVRISEKDEVEFWMIDNNTGIEKLMSSGSGYERSIASLALRAVLSKVCSLPKPNIVVFDEVFGKISNENLEMVSQFFQKIKEYFEKIFVITHNPLVSQWADSVVKINKDNNVSKVEQ
jgi:DNA repair exonuclease SbcCD ATPase subunit|tara:strand:- start:1592 stop:3967 length:2376 start_codon:yes stop_codon:yes gene_type:complete